MSVKIKDVAYQPMNEIHKNEVEILNRLLSKILKHEKIEKEFSEFIEDVKHHFSFEEDLMKKYGFFAYIPHKMEHDRILNELQSLSSKLNDYDFLYKYFNESFLPWLENHVATMDTVTAGFFDRVITR
jgi:hemerythrin